MLVFLSALLGLSLGSFANVCIYRIPRKLSVVTPRSFCPRCGRTLEWYELFPVLSFLYLKGRCRTCRNGIPVRYPLVELVTGAVSLYLLSHSGVTVDAVVKLLVFALFMIIASADWMHLIIPNTLVVTGLILGTVAASLVSVHALLHAILGAFLAAGFILIVRVLGNKAFGKETMGLGDVKLAGLVGLLIGFQSFLVAAWLASILGIVYWGVRWVINRAGGEKRLPFGTFLSVTTLVLYLAPMPSIPFIH